MTRLSISDCGEHALVDLRETKRARRLRYMSQKGLKFDSFAWTRRSATLRYGVAMLCVSAALANIAISPMPAPIATCVVAVIVATWFGGTRPGVLATILSWSAIALFSDRLLPRTFYFLTISGFIVWVMESERRTAQSLQRARDHLRLTIDTIPTMAWTLTADGKLEFLNRRWLQYTGLSPEKALDDGLSVLHPDDMTRVVDRWRQALSDRQGYDDETRLRRADGEYRSFLVRTVPLFDDDGALLRWYGTSSDIDDAKRAEQALRDGADQLQQLSRRLVEVQEAERHDISRELHDRVGQTLTAMRINMDMIRKALEEHDEAEVRGRNEDSMQLIDSAFKAVRNVMYELRPPMLDEFGLVVSLKWYARQFSERTGVRVEVRGVEGWRCGPEAEIALFRIAQEALTNIARHARAKTARILLRRDLDAMVLTIEDDGVGIGGAKDLERPGYGMVGMRERAESVGATLEVAARVARGTRITVSVPVWSGRWVTAEDDPLKRFRTKPASDS